MFYYWWQFVYYAISVRAMWIRNGSYITGMPPLSHLIFRAFASSARQPFEQAPRDHLPQKFRNLNSILEVLRKLFPGGCENSFFRLSLSAPDNHSSELPAIIYRRNLGVEPQLLNFFGKCSRWGGENSLSGFRFQRQAVTRASSPGPFSKEIQFLNFFGKCSREGAKIHFPGFRFQSQAVTRASSPGAFPEEI